MIINLQHCLKLTECIKNTPQGVKKDDMDHLCLHYCSYYDSVQYSQKRIHVGAKREVLSVIGNFISTKIPIVLRVDDCVIVTIISINDMIRWLINSML